MRISMQEKEAHIDP